jgi:muramidase (phage lysozyme)
MTANMDAFLSMIAYSEGTSTIQDSDNGYNVLVGGSLFHSYADHPRRHIYCKRLNVWSTAAGRYQILEKYYDAYKRMLGLYDFSPYAQDRIAIQLIKECDATVDITLGNIKQAMYRCRSRWASLPNSGYGQHENKQTELLMSYLGNGGKLA